MITVTVFPASGIQYQTAVPEPVTVPLVSMNTIGRGMSAMPLASAPHAPVFHDDAALVDEFFERFEEFADACQLTSAERAKCFLRYVPDLDLREYFRTRVAYENADYIGLKLAILDEYPRLRRRGHHTLEKLNNLIEDHARLEINTETELIHYFRKFSVTADSLVKNGVLTSRERESYFWRGLHPHNQEEIATYLATPSRRRLEQTPPPPRATIREIMEAGRRAYSEDALNDPEL